METKELKSALIANIKNELKDFTQVQRDLKKSRKLEFRPKDRSLQDICDEIDRNSQKITKLLFYYRWILHGIKYWDNRDIHSFKDYYIYNCHTEEWWDKEILYGDYKGMTWGEKTIIDSKSFYSRKLEEYGITGNATDAFLVQLINNK